MPHQCTNCGHTFADGSKEMLSGCPDCGGNKFQFHHGSVPEEPPTDATPPPDGDGSSVANAVGKAANTVRDIVGSSDDPPAGREETTAGPISGPASDPASSTADADAPVDADAPPSGATADAADAVESPASDASTDTDPDADATPSPSSGGPVDRAEKRFSHEDGHDAIVEHASDRDPAGESAGSSGDSPSALDREWPAVSRPDDPEDTAQAAARSGFADPDVETSGDDESGTGADTGEGVDAGDEGEIDETVDAASADDSTGSADSGLGDIRIADEEPLDESTEGLDESTDATGRSGIDTIGDAAPAGASDPTDAREPADVDDHADASDPVDANDSADASDPPGANDPAESPGLEELRRELDDQFESIKIVEPGQYELNLMELYNREEYIIALQENGRYVIEVPDTWRE